MGILDEIEKMAETEDTVELLRNVLRNQKEIIQRLQRIEKEFKSVKKRNCGE